MNVVLIDPPPQQRIEQHDVRKYAHLGLAYIAAYLKSQGVNCSLIDGKFERLDFGRVERRLYAIKPNIIGITAMTHEIPQANRVAEEAKKVFPEAIIVIGGAHVTALPVQTLAEFPAFDVAVFGEGEYTFFELVDAIANARSLEGIRGIAYRTANGIRQNEPRELISNLDELPPPAWELYPRASEYPIITSRGCPFRCNFCMRLMGNRVRKRTVQNVFNELKNCIDTYGTKHIHFLDETLAVDRKHLNELLDLILESGLYKKFYWDGQSRPDIIDYDLFSKMKAAGCTWLGFGIESGNEKILRASGKAMTLNHVEKTLNTAKKAGIKTDGYFILGHPFETIGTAKDTINFATRLNPTRITIGIMTPYPGTKIYEMAKSGKGGYKLISNDWADFNKNIGNSLELEKLPRKELERLQMWGYFQFYLFNFRLIAGIQYILNQWRLGLAILKKFLFNRSGAS